jgi:hypothetical protein
MPPPVEILYAVPIGAVIAWCPPPNATLPPDFVVCDGSAISDKDSPFNGKNAPNLTNQFVLGAGGSVAVNQQGGNTTFNVQGWASGAIATGPTTASTSQDNVQNILIVRNGVNSTYRYDLTTDDDPWNDGNHHHNVAFTVPPPGWVALTYIMRIK